MNPQSGISRSVMTTAGRGLLAHSRSGIPLPATLVGPLGTFNGAGSVATPIVKTTLCFRRSWSWGVPGALPLPPPPDYGCPNSLAGLLKREFDCVLTAFC